MLIKLLKKTKKAIFSQITREQKKRFEKIFPEELKIFTHLTSDELFALHTISKRLADNSIAVEIGSYLGASACIICAGLQKQSKLYCIDTWGNHAMIYENDDSRDESLVEKNTYEEFRQNSIKYRDKIIELRGWSTDVIGELSSKVNKIDFLFIDGDHSYEGVKADWDLYAVLLKNGSYVAFHDTEWAEGVMRVINEDVLPKALLVKKLPNLRVYKMK